MGCGPSNILQNLKKNTAGRGEANNPSANDLAFSGTSEDRKRIKSGTKSVTLREARGSRGYAKRLTLESLVHKRSRISILLIFKKNNPQCLAFSRAAENLKHGCSVLGDVRDLGDAYHKLQPDVVIVDCRPGSGINPEECSRIIRRGEEENGHRAVLVAVRPQILTDPDSETMMKLLEAGYDTQFLENTNLVACQSELQSIQHSHVGSASYAGVCYLLLGILDAVSDAVEVMDADCRIQYINRSSELMSGLDGDQVRGRSYFETLVQNAADNNKMATLVGDSLQPRSMVMPFAGKNGQNIHQLATLLPMLNKSGRLEHLVSIHSNVAQQKTSESSSTPTSESKPKTRKESVVRLPSMTIEAPITKVINMITSLQDTCPDDVSDSLNKVMDVLRSSELYSPYFNESVKGDKFTSELVGGLMTGEKDDYINRRVSVVKRPSYTSDQILLSKSSFHSAGHASGSASPEVENLLEGEDKWEFDIISLERLTNKKPLFHLAMRTFQRFEVTEFLQVDDTVMANWLHMIESNYHQTNPYHNSTHAADVMHASAYFLSCDQVKTIFDHIDEVACLIAAVIHDLDHPGKTNSFLVNSNADLAFLYNDLAVLESHHVSLAYRLTLKSPETNIFKNISRDDFKQLRQQVIDMVLATEMTKHFEHLNKFVSVVNQTSLHDASMSSQDESEAILKLSSVENKTLVKRMLIKCADVSNPARPLHLCREWAVRIAKEYCDQSDEEKLQGLPVVMPMFDSKSCNVPKSQTSFIDLFIKDMYETWTNFCSLTEMRNCLKENYRFWKDQESIANNQQQQFDT